MCCCKLQCGADDSLADLLDKASCHAERCAIALGGLHVYIIVLNTLLGRICWSQMMGRCSSACQLQYFKIAHEAVCDDRDML